jgi:uncharacterized membrane protein
MILLILAALFWLLLHFLIAGPLRPALAERIGEFRFQGLFSLLSIAGIVWLAAAYVHAPALLLWGTPPGSRVTALVLMLIAALFFAYGVGPTATSPAIAALPKDRLPVTGVMHITRDPMLWSFALFAAAHLFANGDVASLLLFGPILITALNGMVSIDRKRKRALGRVWDDFMARTSIIPFAAILSGRTALHLDELPLWRALLAVALFLGALFLHPHVIGVSPM